MGPFFMHRFEEPAAALLRVVAGGMLMQHGAQKLFGFLPMPGMPGGTPPLMSQMGLAGTLEFFAGALVVLGLLTRPAAFLLSGMLAVAYFQVHAPNGFWPVLNKGELAALFCFVFLYFSARGGGRYSLDQLIFNRQAHARRMRI